MVDRAGRPVDKGWLGNDRGQHEGTPLLTYISRQTNQRGRCCEKIFLVILAFVLVLGVTIGTYLLCVEGELKPPEKLSFVPRTEWSTRPSRLNVTNLFLPSQRVLLLQTNTKMCWNEIECSNELRDLQKENTEEMGEPDILYNFIVGGDGRVYEGRGWQYRSGFRDDDQDILAVALLGDFTYSPPNELQHKQLQAFLDDAVMRNNLVSCYRILVHDTRSRYLLDVAYDIEKKWSEKICVKKNKKTSHLTNRDA
ncbi:hypothetical protein NQ317_014087 [Molorchus minor]|uniref:Peptidoglycan recognition protein family domain-containing protein n=1 Tax=Molorchus minor TaxID=1323400 RepID=A0ABQ9JFC8_9CUCU|nr:hypothetical protein NQ317_014087 [Molorchus minor]